MTDTIASKENAVTRRREPSFLSLEQLAALRALLTHAREVLHMSRGDIAKGAQVDPVDLDNFVTLRQGSDARSNPQYKTQRPNNTFQKRILSFVLGMSEFKQSNIPEVRSDIAAHVRILYLKLDGIEPRGPKDCTFMHFSSKNAVTEASCSSIANDLHGSFYGYRISTFRNKIIKSYYNVLPFSVYENVPRFENRLKEESGNIRITKGNIIQIDNHYIFFGFVQRSLNSLAGVKIVILRHGQYEKSGALNGIYLSVDNNGSYDFGRTRLERTDEIYNEDNIGFIGIDDISFIKELAIDMSKIMDGNLDDALRDMMLMSSLNIILDTAKY